MLKIPIDIFAGDFVEQIKKLDPCPRYKDYMLWGKLRVGMSLRDVINSRAIFDSDKHWLLEELYANLTWTYAPYVNSDECELGDKWVYCNLINHVYFLEDIYHHMEES